MEAFQNKPARAILIYDPSATSCELVCAAVTEAGCTPLTVSTKTQAAEITRIHGSSGTGTLAALVLDASADAPLSEIILRSILGVPGAEDLVGLLLVDPKNRAPLPSAAGLPSLARPFSRSELVIVIKEALGDVDADVDSDVDADADSDADSDATDAASSDPTARPALRCELPHFPLHSALHALDAAFASGVVSIDDGELSAQLVVHEGRLLRATMRGDDDDDPTHEIGFYLPHDDGTAQDHDAALERVTCGELDADTIMAAIEAHAFEVLRVVETWEAATLTFWPQAPAARFDEWCATHTSPRPPALGGAVLACMASAENLLEMQARSMEFDQVLMRRDAEVARLRETLDEEELQVLEHINGKLTLKEVSRKAGYGSFAVAKIVARLSHAGIVERRAPPTFV